MMRFATDTCGGKVSLASDRSAKVPKARICVTRSFTLKQVLDFFREYPNGISWYLLANVLGGRSTHILKFRAALPKPIQGPSVQRHGWCISQKSSNPIVDDFRIAGNIRCNNRSTTQHGLDHDEGKTLVSGWHDKNVIFCPDFFD